MLGGLTRAIVQITGEPMELPAMIIPREIVGEQRKHFQRFLNASDGPAVTSLRDYVFMQDFTREMHRGKEFTNPRENEEHRALDNREALSKQLAGLGCAAFVSILELVILRDESNLCPPTFDSTFDAHPLSKRR